MPDYTLLQGDCLEVMPTLEKGSVGMVFADLPYGVTRNRWDSCIDLTALWRAINAVSHSNAVQAFTATQPFGSAIITSNLSRFRYDIVWNKMLVAGFLNAKKMPLRQHETVLVFGSPKSTYNPQMREGKPYIKKHGKEFSKNYGTTHMRPHINEDGARHPTSILSYPTTRVTGQHPTQKPLALLEWLIATYTNPGDTVLDPCFGSNTTGVACARLGRRYIGIEKDPTYFAAGKARLEAEHARLAEQPAQGALAI